MTKTETRKKIEDVRVRYGYSGKPYANLISRILARNNERVSRRIGELSAHQWRKALAKIGTEGRNFVIPSLHEVLPKREIVILKAAQSGRKISQTLRDRLSANLRAVLDKRTPKTGEQTFIRRRGTLAGEINPRLIREFREAITNTFQSYTRKDKRLGVPANVKAISVTEMRSAIGLMKRNFADQIEARNPDVALDKGWIHNSSLSKIGRLGHIALNGKWIKNSEKFRVQVYERIGGRMIKTQVLLASGPHAPELPGSETISCNCDLIYRARRAA